MLFARKSLVILSWLYIVLLPVQFLLAGAGIMGGDLEAHMGFGVMVLGTLLPLLLLVLALIGRAWNVAGLALVLAVVVHLLPALPSADNAWVAGLHPVIALLTWPFAYFVLLRASRAKVAEAEARRSGGQTPAPAPA